MTYPRWHDELAQLERAYFSRLVEVCNGSQLLITKLSGLPRSSVRNILDRNDLLKRCAELRSTRERIRHLPQCKSRDRRWCGCPQLRAAE